MPRGMRAAHFGSGVSVTTDAGTYQHAIIEPYLVTVCWCGETFWMVQRDDILEGRAVECGDEQCVADPKFEVVDPADSIMVYLKNSSWHACAQSKVEAHARGRRHKEGVRLRALNLAERERDVMTQLRGYQLRRPLTYGDLAGPRVKSKIARRRTQVQNLVEGGMHPIEVAGALGIKYSDVMNDIGALRRVGIVVRFENRQGAHLRKASQN